MTNIDDNNWNPGHTIGGGYPWAGIESRLSWPKRPIVKINPADNKVYFDAAGVEYKEPIVRAKNMAIAISAHRSGGILTITEEDYDNYVKKSEAMEFEDFLLHRCAEFAEALETAEGQIEDMLKEDPFSPELLGFEVVHANRDISMPPVEIYVSTFDSRYSLYRDPSGAESVWMLIKKVNDGPENFQETKLYLPCQRIAYAALSALMIPMRERKPAATEMKTLNLEPDENFEHLMQILERAKNELIGQISVPAKLLCDEVKGVNDKTFVEKVLDEATVRLKQDTLMVLAPQPTYKDGIRRILLPPIEAAAWKAELKMRNQTHIVQFSRPNAINETCLALKSVNATSDKEALTKAKFLLETDTENPVTDVKFEELAIVDLD